MLVEFSLVFVIFMLVLYALITFGVLLASKNSLTHAAAEGARAAVAVVDDTSTPGVDEREQRALDQVTKSLSWLGNRFQPGDATAKVAACGGGAPVGTQCITVTVTYPYSTRPIIPPAPGLGLVIPDKLTSTAVVELT
ncbi:MAG TPA: TadE/TadG family type IV pilus assembly protein [Acidimicrobiales bacterium]|nr:TadE/TadG family type IV pilus assembly protein [Acidimicrobiales bacterium]